MADVLPMPTLTGVIVPMQPNSCPIESALSVYYSPKSTYAVL
jgi:hypothetical protein